MYVHIYQSYGLIFYLHEWLLCLLYINVGKYTSLMDSSWHTDNPPWENHLSSKFARGFSLSFWFVARWRWELASDTRLKLQYLLSMFLGQDFGSQMSLWLFRWVAGWSCWWECWSLCWFSSEYSWSSWFVFWILSLFFSTPLYTMTM